MFRWEEGAGRTRGHHRHHHLHLQRESKIKDSHPIQTTLSLVFLRCLMTPATSLLHWQGCKSSHVGNWVMMNMTFQFWGTPQAPLVISLGTLACTTLPQTQGSWILSEVGSSEHKAMFRICTMDMGMGTWGRWTMAMLVLVLVVGLVER